MFSSSMNRNVIKDMNEKNVMLLHSQTPNAYIGAFKLLGRSITYDTMRIKWHYLYGHNVDLSHIYTQCKIYHEHTMYRYTTNSI